MTPLTIDISIWGTQVSLPVETDPQDPDPSPVYQRAQRIQGSGGQGASTYALALIASGDGAPEIDMFAEGCSPEDFMNLISRLTGDTMREQMNTEREDLERNKTELKQMNDEKAKSTKEWNDKCVAAHKNDALSDALGILEIAGLAVASVISVGVTVLSAGATSSLTLMTVSMLAQAATNKALSSQGQAEIGLAKGSKYVIAAIARAGGASAEDADKHAEMVSGVTVIASPFCGAALLDPEFAGQALSGLMREFGTSKEKASYGMLAGTIAAQIVSMSAGGKMATGAASTAQKIASQVKMAERSANQLKLIRYMARSQYVTAGANGGGGLANGSVHLETAEAKHDADVEHAQTQDVQAEVEARQERVRRTLDAVSATAQHMQDVYQFAADASKSRAHCQQTVIKNTGSLKG